MNTNKLIRKLEDFFNFSKKKQKKKHDKFLKIVKKLESKKSELEIELIDEGTRDRTNDKYHELSHKLNVVSKFIIKAYELTQAN